MWTLESDGSTLENKRIWLRPGKKYLFGRTTPQKGRYAGFVINEKSVSRKHITLSVSKVKPGNASLVDARSEVILQDENTKFGTEIDGERISGTTKTLKHDKHVFRLGKTNHAFTIKWHPVVFSFSFSSKDVKGGKDPLVTMRNRLEDLDIKTIIPYLIDKTTHVVCSKRNTAKGLQALINAKYIVAESFIDAVTFATTPGDLDELESLSPLEEDFDANWPNAIDHLPPKSKEPNERPKEFFKPNPERISIFEGYTFVFYDEIQFETLEAPILNGGGKARVFPLEPGKTTVQQLIRDVKQVAGEKGLGEFEDGSVGKGVVIVRFRGKKEHQDWAIDLGDQLAIALNQRMIEQSEFMDAILENSAENFRKPLQEEDELESESHPDLITQREHDIANINKEAIPKSSVTRKGPREPIQSRFKGFDDDSDEDTKAGSLQSMMEDTQIRNLVNRGKSQQNLPSNYITDPGIEDESQELESAPQVHMSKKRPASALEDDNEEDLIDQMLPAAAAMKRRKVEEQDEARRTGVAPATSFGKSQSKSEPEIRERSKKEINIQEVVRERREAEEDAARQDEASLRETLNGLNVDDIKNLAVVEEMELPAPTKQISRVHGNGMPNHRWDEAWNGRKNFKKFRRRGEGTQARRGQSVIVPLEEEKKKDFGIGEEYWLKSDNAKKKTKDKEREQHRTSQDTLSQPYTTARSHHEEIEHVPPELIINDDDYPDTIDVDAPRTTRRMDAIAHRQDKEELGSDIRASKSTLGKRQASDHARLPAKKQKILDDVPEDSDSEDELKFRVRRRNPGSKNTG